MPLIQFSVGDTLRARNLDPGWYSFQITSVVGPHPNSKQDGFNYDVTFTLIDKGPDLDGKEIKRVFSNKAISMMIPLILAASGKAMTELKPEAFNFNTDDLMGKKIDGKVVVDIWEGRPNNKCEEYLPYKKAVGQPAPF